MKIVSKISVIVAFLFLILYITKPFSREVEKDISEKGFRGIITNLKKTPRQYDQLELLEKNNKKIYIIDRLRYYRNYSINIGDSLIKENNACIFYYKRKDSIIFYIKDACKEIFLNFPY